MPIKTKKDVYIKKVVFEVRIENAAPVFLIGTIEKTAFEISRELSMTNFSRRYFDRQIMLIKNRVRTVNLYIAGKLMLFLNFSIFRFLFNLLYFMLNNRVNINSCHNKCHTRHIDFYHIYIITFCNTCFCDT